MKALFLFVAFGLGLIVSGAEAGPRLDAIRARGTLNCGVAVAERGMSFRDARGAVTGFEADLCRGVAIAIFGAPNVSFRPTTTLQDFLNANDVDLVIRGLTHSFRRETNANIRFAATYIYDGQTFLVRSAANSRSIDQLARRSICVSSDMFADFLPALERHFQQRNLVLNARSVRTRAESEQLFFAGQCDAVTADATELASAVIQHGGTPGTFTILAEQITKEPLAPLLRKGDDHFFDIVNWTIYALVNAEELGLTKNNIDSFAGTSDRDIAAFLASPPPASGMHAAWSARLIRALGNYGELFDRHLGANSPARMPRGLNRLWTQGGLLYAPPVR
jgi:general L-amino acid transport system substrate-binding protein